MVRRSFPPAPSALPCALVLLACVASVESSDMPFSHNWRGGLVLGGVDVVAYHTLDADSRTPVYGDPAWSHAITRSAEEYTFLFSSSANLDLFRSNLTKYIPRNGGYCSWGFANEWRSEDCDADFNPHIWDGECSECDCALLYGNAVNKWAWEKGVMGPPAGLTDGWSIYNGQLYFNIWDSYRVRWLQRVEENQALADARWIAYFGSLDAGPLNIGCYPDTWRQCVQLDYPTDMGALPAALQEGEDTAGVGDASNDTAGEAVEDPVTGGTDTDAAETVDDNADGVGSAGVDNAADQGDDAGDTGEPAGTPSPTSSPTDSPTSSPTAPRRTDVTSTTTFSSLDISAFADAAFNASFRESFIAQMAAGAGLPTSNIVIDFITSGSVTVESTAFFASEPAALDFAILISNEPATVYTADAFRTYGNITVSCGLPIPHGYVASTRSPTAPFTPDATGTSGNFTGNGAMSAQPAFAVAVASALSCALMLLRA